MSEQVNKALYRISRIFGFLLAIRVCLYWSPMLQSTPKRNSLIIGPELIGNHSIYINKSSLILLLVYLPLRKKELPDICRQVDRNFCFRFDPGHSNGNAAGSGV